MLKEPITIPIVFVEGMLSGLVARGAHCEPHLQKVGIDPSRMRHAGARVTAAQYVALFQLLIDCYDDEILGFLSRPLRRGTYALLVRNVARSSSLQTALGRLATTFPLFQDDIELAIVQRGEHTGIALHFRTPEISRQPFVHELLLRALWRLVAWLAGGNLPAAGFDFAFAKPAYEYHYARVFPHMRRFGVAVSTLWLPRARLAGAIDKSDARIRAYISSAVTNVIIPWSGDDFTARRVRQYLLRTATWPGLTEAAAALHVSPATLQRKLAMESTTFQTLKDELRRDIAISRLTAGATPLCELAEHLGFADSSAFQRAFRRWTGSSPGAYRRFDLNPSRRQ